MKITRYKRSEKTGNLIAFFSIAYNTDLGAFYINDLKLFQKDGSRFIAMPDREYKNEHGEKKYAPHCGFSDRESKQKFQEQVLQAIDDFAKEQSLPKKAEPTKQMEMSLKIKDSNPSSLDDVPF